MWFAKGNARLIHMDKVDNLFYWLKMKLHVACRLLKDTAEQMYTSSCTGQQKVSRRTFAVKRSTKCDPTYSAYEWNFNILWNNRVLLARNVGAGDFRITKCSLDIVWHQMGYGFACQLDGPNKKTHGKTHTRFIYRWQQTRPTRQHTSTFRVLKRATLTKVKKYHGDGASKCAKSDFSLLSN